MLILLSMGCAHTQEAKPWIKSGFMPPDENYKFYIGISDPKPTENDARKSAQENAILELVQREFSFDRNVTIVAVEGSSGALLANRSYLSIESVNLSDFELTDQSIITLPGIVRQYQCKSLYRLSRTSIAEQKKNIKAQGKKSKKDWSEEKEREIASVVQKEIQEKDARALDRIQAVEDWENAFPGVALDLGVAMGQFAGFSSSFLGLKPSLRFRLMKGIYLGVGGSVSSGSDRYPATSEHLRPKDAEGYRETFDRDDSRAYRIFARFYPVYNAWEALFLDVGVGSELLTPTCPKKIDGTCLASPEPKLVSQFVNAGLGFQLLAPRGTDLAGCSIWLDLGGVYFPASKLKHGFSTSIGIGIPLMRR